MVQQRTGLAAVCTYVQYRPLTKGSSRSFSSSEGLKIRIWQLQCIVCYCAAHCCSESTLFGNLFICFWPGALLASALFSRATALWRTLSPRGRLISPHGRLLSPHRNLLSPHGSLLSPYRNLLSPHGRLLSPHWHPTCSLVRVCALSSSGFGTFLKFNLVWGLLNK
jgi:hypothetical protein